MPFAIFGFCIFWFFLLNFDTPSCPKTNQEQQTTQEQKNCPKTKEANVTLDSKGVSGNND